MRWYAIPPESSISPTAEQHGKTLPTHSSVSRSNLPGSLDAGFCMTWRKTIRAWAVSPSQGTRTGAVHIHGMTSVATTRSPPVMSSPCGRRNGTGQGLPGSCRTSAACSRLPYFLFFFFFLRLLLLLLFLFPFLSTSPLHSTPSRHTI